MKKKQNYFHKQTNVFRFATCIVFFVIMIVCSSCLPPPPPLPLAPVIVKRFANITTSPPGATISVNNKIIGTSPVPYTFNFSAQPVYKITCSKNDHIPTTIKVNLEKLDSNDGNIKMALKVHPYIAATSLEYPTNKWFSLELIPDVMEREDWNKVVALIKTKFPQIKKENARKGLIETQFVKRTYPFNKGFIYLRSRLKTKFSREVPVLIMDFHLQTETSKDGVVWEEYDRVVQGDAQMIRNIKKRFGYHR